MNLLILVKWWKFLFLIHNKHSEVKQELLKHVTKETALGQCLEYAHNIEGNLQSVELSKYVDKYKVSSSTGSVTSNFDAVRRKLGDVMSHQQGKTQKMRSLSVISVA